MSLTEILQASTKLKPHERASLRAYLHMLDRANDPAWKKEMTVRLRNMKAGNEITSDEYYRRVSALDRAKARKRKAA